MATEYDLGSVIGPQGATGPQGISVTNVSINAQGNLIVTLSNGSNVNAGNAKGAKGDKGEIGKSAYQQAKEGGYAGTEAQFIAELNSIASKTDKVMGATDNFAAFDANGNLKNSGKSAGKAEGIATLDSNSKLVQMPTVSDVGGSNQNMLTNWYFGPGVINQRAQTNYSGAFIFTIDCWRTGDNATISVDENGISLIAPSVEDCYMFQRLERLLPGTYTYSLLFANNTNIVSIANVSTDRLDAERPYSTSPSGLLSYTFENKEILEPEMAFYRIHSNGQCKLIAIKLEAGTSQTLAKKNVNGNWVLTDPPPDYGQELARCQRHYRRYGAGLTLLSQFGMPLLTLVFSPTMRITPSVELLSDTIPFYANGVEYILSQASISEQFCSYSGATFVRLYGTLNTALSENTVLRYNATQDLFGFDANL